MSREVRHGHVGSLVPFVAALLLSGHPLAAQTTPSSPPSPASGGAQARIHLEAGVRHTSLRSQDAFLLGGGARFELGSPFSFGAAGWVLDGPVELDRGSTGGLRLKIAYGGVVTGWGLPTLGPLHTSVRVLWGAGNGKVELPVVRTEIASDNFVVVEPGMVWTIGLAGPLHLAADVSYRWVAAVEDLAGVAPEQIRGMSLSLGLSLGPF